MKKILLSAAAITVLFAACKKDDNTPANTNSWKIGSTTYTASTVTAANNTLMAVSGTNFISMTFATLPTANGTYRVVSSSPGSMEMLVSAMTLSSTDTSSYLVTGLDSVNATITVNSGKVGVTLPDAWAKKVSVTNDSVKISAKLTQN